MMKQLIFTSITFMMLLSFSNVKSQELKTEFEIVKDILKTEKRFYVENHMNLSEEEEDIFWPIYEDYEIDRAKFSRKRIDALKLYVENYGQMSNSIADDMIDDVLSFQRKEYKLKRKYYRLMRNKLSARIAARFIQIEEFINASIKYRIMETLPFVKE